MEPAAAVHWSWRGAAHGAIVALPATIVTPAAPAAGLALAVGVLPAAAVGLRGERRGRGAIVVAGVLAGVALLLGSLVSQWPVVAVCAVFILCVLVALWVPHGGRVAPLVLGLGLPLYGAGLSLAPATGASAAVLIAGGSVYAWLVSLPWPERTSAPPAAAPPPTRRTMLIYGVQIGVAGAAAAGIGFALGVDHPGWACVAALLVSRPDRRQLDARGWGRGLSVTAGAILACALVWVAAPPLVVAGLVLAVLAVAAATAGSRWYIFPFFSTTLVLALLLVDRDDPPAHWLIERIVLTLLGVALAVAAAAIVPFLARILTGPAERGD